MSKALWWKEWRQLRLLRQGGAALVLVMPLVLLAAAEAGAQGWLPFRTVSSYSAATVLQNVMPMMLALGAWPLLALMTGAQAFCGDRSAGTETFLLERPVSRVKVWLVRLLATLGTLAVVLVVHMGVWWLLIRIWGNPAAFDEVDTGTRILMGWIPLDSAGRWLLVGLLTTVTGTAAGMAAAAVARSPMQALLVGIPLGFLPFALGGLLASLFPFARIGDLHLSLILPWLILLPAFLAGSFRASCRGEPAGGGRLRRTLVVLGAAVVATPVLIGAASPLVARWDAELALGNTDLLASPDGTTVFVWNLYQGGGWLVETATGKKLRFFRPRVLGAAWNPNDSRLAVVRASSLSEPPAVEIYDPSGRPVGDSPLECPECTWTWGDRIVWVGERLVSPAYTRRGGNGLVMLDLASGERVTFFPEHGLVHGRLVGPSDAGDYYHLAEGEQPETTEVQRIDLRNGEIETLLTLETEAAAWFSGGISPSGRYCGLRADSTWLILDLETGEQFPVGWRPVWLAGDRLAWLARDDAGVNLIVGSPGQVGPVHALPGATRAWLTASPGRKKLLVDGSTSDGTMTEPLHWIYDESSDRLTRLDGLMAPAQPGDYTHVDWAGPETVAVVGPRELAFRDLQGAPRLRYVVGGEVRGYDARGTVRPHAGPAGAS